MNHCVYNLQTGEIEKLISGPPEILALQFDPTTHGMLPGEYTPDSHYIDNFTAVAIPPKQSTKHAFDYTTKQWVDPRTFPERQAEKWGEIKTTRTMVEHGGFSVNGLTFDSDPVSQAKIQGAVMLAMLADDTFTIDWTLADNSVQTLTKAQLMDVGIALGQHVSSAHEQARMRRTEIYAAESLEEIELIIW